MNKNIPWKVYIEIRILGEYRLAKKSKVGVQRWLATRWLRSLLGGRKESREHKHTTSSVAAGPHDRRDRGRWSFKSGRDSSCSAVPIPAPNRADDIAWLRALYGKQRRTEQGQHAIAVAAATAAAADAAVAAAAQAAVAVVRLTNHGRASFSAASMSGS
ncbi:hypothetical protein HPP92_008489 [Vanilla planifolia]|uniref:Uncharacterized protein n=1 Tax=Vanilla planifolia TaxID=51239 RepID=A0A835R8G0_VANPL|nr:hypothetical protein HPP92_008489 [Vanilla planifolia]